MSHVPYASAIRSVMYAIVCTHPDISHVVRAVSRFMGNLRKTHWQALKWITQYLKGTSDVGLVYDRILIHVAILLAMRILIALEIWIKRDL